MIRIRKDCSTVLRPFAVLALTALTVLSGCLNGTGTVSSTKSQNSTAANPPLTTPVASTTPVCVKIYSQGGAVSAGETLMTSDAGATLQLSARAFNDASCTTPIAGATFVWSSSAVNFVAVDTTGRISSRSLPGTSTIRATASNGIFNSNTVVVTTQDHAVASAVAAPASVSVGAGATQQIVLTLRNAVPAPITAARAVVWSTSNAAVATVSQTGLVTGVAVGTATLTARIAATSMSLTTDANAVVVTVPVTVTTGVGPSPTPSPSPSPSGTPIPDLTLSLVTGSFDPMGTTAYRLGATSATTPIVKLKATSTVVPDNKLNCTYSISGTPMAVVGGGTFSIPSPDRNGSGANNHRDFLATTKGYARFEVSCTGISPYSGTRTASYPASGSTFKIRAATDSLSSAVVATFNVAPTLPAPTHLASLPLFTGGGTTQLFAYLTDEWSERVTLGSSSCQWTSSNASIVNGVPSAAAGGTITITPSATSTGTTNLSVNCTPGGQWAGAKASAPTVITVTNLSPSPTPTPSPSSTPTGPPAGPTAITAIDFFAVPILPIVKYSDVSMVDLTGVQSKTVWLQLKNSAGYISDAEMIQSSSCSVSSADPTTVSVPATVLPATLPGTNPSIQSYLFVVGNLKASSTPVKVTVTCAGNAGSSIATTPFSATFNVVTLNTAGPKKAIRKVRLFAYAPTIPASPLPAEFDTGKPLSLGLSSSQQIFAVAYTDNDVQISHSVFQAEANCSASAYMLSTPNTFRVNDDGFGRSVNGAGVYSIGVTGGGVAGQGNVLVTCGANPGSTVLELGTGSGFMVNVAPGGGGTPPSPATLRFRSLNGAYEYSSSTPLSLTVGGTQSVYVTGYTDPNTPIFDLVFSSEATCQTPTISGVAGATITNAGFVGTLYQFTVSAVGAATGTAMVSVTCSAKPGGSLVQTFPSTTVTFPVSIVSGGSTGGGTSGGTSGGGNCSVDNLNCI